MGLRIRIREINREESNGTKSKFHVAQTQNLL